IDNLYYLTYTAFDGVNALGAWAISKDLLHWQKKGLVVPKVTYNKFNSHAKTKKKLNEKYFRFNHHEGLLQKKGREVLIWDKDVILFPRKIEDHFVFLHRIKPDIQIVMGVKNLEDLTPEFWLDYFNDFNDHILMKPKYDHEASYIGGGCPPIETELGWLIIYHGVQDSVKGYVYCVCVALLDLNNPKIEKARLPYPLFKPEFKWELKGRVNNVCFPTGTVLFGDTLYIYYGAADEQIACASVSLSELLKELMLNTAQNEK
ncbi:MAG: pesticidal protein Cry7Aa, partial [Flavobacterium sp.]